MNVHQKTDMLFFVAIFNMTGSAQGHQVLDLVFSLAATHTPAVNMVNVHSSGAADLTGNKVIASKTKMIQINLDMLLHFQPFFILA